MFILAHMTSLPYIPYFQTTRYRVQAIIELAQIIPTDEAADLGSGDGRIVIALAQAGARAHGYELDLTLQKLSQQNIRKAELKNAYIHGKDFWQEDLSRYTVITIYPMPDILEALEKKLQKELMPGTRVLTNYYSLPTWKEEQKKDNVWLYRK
jgi:16S rRNA A1518/A1519 N6-dimethyltransferase RsmA/KsgA/DIM1 with predicted DNA glycosylase/AP lyase activity